MKNVFSLIPLAIILCASTFAQTQPRTGDRVFDPKKPSIMSLEATDKLADEAVQKILNLHNETRKNENAAVYPIGHSPSETEVNWNIQQKAHTAAIKTIDGFATHYTGHPASQEEVCRATTLLDAAIKRYLENQIGSKATPAQKDFKINELFSQSPELQVVYTTVGTCIALRPWIEKSTTALKK